MQKLKLKSSCPLKTWTKDNTPALLHLAESLITDAFHLIDEYVEKDYILDIATLRRRTQNEGLKFIVSTMPALFKAFLVYLETGHGAYGSFAIKPATGHPLFLHGLFSLACVVDEKGIKAFSALYQICVFMKKLRGPYTETTLNKHKRDFVATDNLIGALNHDNDFDALIINEASFLIRDVFSCVESQEQFDGLFKPRPGPGATNTPSHHYERYAINKIGNIDVEMMLYDWMYYNHQSLHDSSATITDKWLTEDTYTSRLKAVPKTFGKPRLICIEDNEMQFLQQGLKSLMYKTIQTHPLTMGKVNFDDQTVNQRFALEASKHLQLATIDMSEASDRISKVLVDKLFSRSPLMQYYLSILSTNVISIDGLNYQCYKFAPMGSGICFPVMSIVHWALIRAIMVLSSDLSDCIDSLHVYGDDIILSSKAYAAVTTILPRFGMKLNTDKSYVTSHFRESCGVDAYNGIKVTPVYLKHTPTIVMGPSATLSTIAVESQLYESGYTKTACAIRSMTTVSGYTSIGSPPVSWKRQFHPEPVYTKVRWNKWLQQFEYRTRVIINKNKDNTKISIQDNSAILRYFLSNATEHNDKWARLNLVFKWRWLKCYDFYDIKDRTYQCSDPAVQAKSTCCVYPAWDKPE